MDNYVFPMIFIYYTVYHYIPLLLFRLCHCLELQDRLETKCCLSYLTKSGKCL